MEIKYEISTKDKLEISYRAYILSSLLSLGFSSTNKGTFYLRDLILIAIQSNFNDSDIRLKDLRNILAKQKGNSSKTIKSYIDYAFKFRDIQKAENNFENIFGFEYDSYFITAKSIISLMVGLIYNKELVH